MPLTSAAALATSSQISGKRKTEVLDDRSLECKQSFPDSGRVNG